MYLKATKVHYISFRSSIERRVLRVLRDRSDQVESNAIDSRTRNIKRAAEKGKRAYRGLYNSANWSTNYSRAHTYEDGDNSEPMRIAFENYASIPPIRDSLFPAERSFPLFCAPVTMYRRTRYYPHNERMRAYVSACSPREGQASA